MIVCSLILLNSWWVMNRTSTFMRSSKTASAILDAVSRVSRTAFRLGVSSHSAVRSTSDLPVQSDRAPGSEQDHVVAVRGLLKFSRHFYRPGIVRVVDNSCCRVLSLWFVLSACLFRLPEVETGGLCCQTQRPACSRGLVPVTSWSVIVPGLDWRLCKLSPVFPGDQLPGAAQVLAPS